MTEDTNPNPEAAEDAQEAPESTTTLAPDAMQRELEKARKEAAKYRTRLREREEAEKAAQEAKKQAELTAEERATAAEKRAAEALEAAEARVLTAERKAALAGKLTNVDRVLRLMDDQEAYFDAGTPDVDRILKDFPEYAPPAVGPGAIRAPGAPAHTGKTDHLKPEEFKDKGLDWAIRNLDRLKPPG